MRCEHVSQRLPVDFSGASANAGEDRDLASNATLAESEIKLIEPLGYLDFMRLYSGARLVLTDSGGLQEETTVLGIPCLTLRHNTERPITIEMGTNVLVGQ